MHCWFDAMDYCSMGFRIFPLVANQKIPAISKKQGGNGCLDATCDEEKIAEWVRKYPYANVGIACGNASGVIVVDIDVKQGAGGEDTILELERKGCFFPETAEVLTPSGGRHLYFKYSNKISNNSAGKLGKGIDIRSCGGYVVAPPSSINGQHYQWKTHPDNGIASAPIWLSVLLNPTPKPVRKISINGDNSVKALVKAVETAQQGQRNNILFWAACRLAEDKKLDKPLLLQAAQNSGISPIEAKKTIESAARKVGLS